VVAAIWAQSTGRRLPNGNTLSSSNVLLYRTAFLTRPVTIRVSQRAGRRNARFSLNSASYLVMVCAVRKYRNYRNLMKFVGLLRKQNYVESNHIDLASFPVPQPAACNYVSKYMYLEGLFTLLRMDRMHRNCRVQKEPSKGFPNRLIRAKIRKFKQSVMIQGQSTKIVTLPSAPDMYF
jgi:hypothetical protein